MKIGNINMTQLVSTKKESLGLLAFAIWTAISVPIFAGVLNYPNLILGLTFAACALILATPSPRVLSGVLVGFIGVLNLLVLGNVFPIETAWWLTIVFLVGVLFIEYAKLGKASKQSRYVVVIPMLSLFFMFILALANINPVMSVDWATNPMKAIYYSALLLLTGLLSFQFLGWNIMKSKNQGKWITILGLVCIAIGFIGIYQGTLAW